MKPHPSLLVPALAASLLIARPAAATQATDLESAETTLTGFEAENVIEASPITQMHPGGASGGTLEAAVWRPRRGAPGGAAGTAPRSGVNNSRTVLASPNPVCKKADTVWQMPPTSLRWIASTMSADPL